MPDVVGPLGRVVTASTRTRRGGADQVPDLSGPGRLDTANGRLVLHRCLVDGNQSDTDAHIRGWAVRTGLGQRSASELLTMVAQRREAALRSLERGGAVVRRVRLRTAGPVLTGAGEAGARNVGIALHGTYGWPLLPGSTVKGVAHAYARDEHAVPLPERETLFGSPRPGEDGAERAAEGAVIFLDALPDSGGVTVGEHVMTPHHTPYYEGKPDSTGHRTPPAEYHNPVPVPFLAVNSGTFQAAVIAAPEPGDDPEAARKRAVDAADQAARLLTTAVDEIGLGAKTAAGFGYFTAD